MGVRLLPRENILDSINDVLLLETYKILTPKEYNDNLVSNGLTRDLLATRYLRAARKFLKIEAGVIPDFLIRSSDIDIEKDFIEKTTSY
jgi:hypothetical protein